VLKHNLLEFEDDMVVGVTLSAGEVVVGVRLSAVEEREIGPNDASNVCIHAAGLWLL